MKTGCGGLNHPAECRSADDCPLITGQWGQLYILGNTGQLGQSSTRGDRNHSSGLIRLFARQLSACPQSNVQAARYKSESQSTVVPMLTGNYLLSFGFEHLDLVNQLNNQNFICQHLAKLLTLEFMTTSCNSSDLREANYLVKLTFIYLLNSKAPIKFTFDTKMKGNEF